MAKVRQIAQKIGDWAMYDTKFRKLKELQPQLGWQTVQNELYQEARLELVQGEGSNFRNEIFNPKRGRSCNSYEGKSYERYSKGTSSFTKGYRANNEFGSKFVKRGQRGNSSYQPFRRDISPCWRYNRGRYCWGCSRPHICTRCRADHPRRDCLLVQARGTKNRSPSPKRTPVKAKILENMLINSGYDELEIQFLVEGFTFGFHLNCSVSPLSGSCQNLHSAVNTGISDNDSSVEYAKLSDAIRPIKSIGSACYLAKSDIESAFRLLPIHPELFP